MSEGKKKKTNPDSNLSEILRHENESNCPTFILLQSFHTCFIHVKGITTKSGAVTRQAFHGVRTQKLETVNHN